MGLGEGRVHREPGGQLAHGLRCADWLARISHPRETSFCPISRSFKLLPNQQTATSVLLELAGQAGQEGDTESPCVGATPVPGGQEEPDLTDWPHP